MEKIKLALSSLTHTSRKSMGMAVLLIIAVALPITLGLVKQNQDNRQHAAEPCSTENPCQGVGHPLQSCPSGSTASGFTQDTHCQLCKNNSTGEIFSLASCSSGPATCQNPATDCAGKDQTCPDGQVFDKWSCSSQQTCQHTCKPASTSTNQCTSDGSCKPYEHCTYMNETPNFTCKLDPGSCNTNTDCSSGQICSSSNRCVADSTSPSPSGTQSPGGACKTSGSCGGTSGVTCCDGYSCSATHGFTCQPVGGTSGGSGGSTGGVRPSGGATGAGVTGHAYVDTNKNGKWDSTDEAVPNAPITLVYTDQMVAGSKPVTNTQKTSTAGVYTFTITTRSATGLLSAGNTPCYTVSGAASISVSLSSTSLKTQDFRYTKLASCGTSTSPTPTIQTAPRKTPTPTPLRTPTPTHSANSTPTPTRPATVTPTVNASQINLAVSATMPGIGGSQSGNNTAPQHATRTGTVQVFNTNNESVKSGQVTLTYTNGVYKGTVEMTNLAEGFYYVKVGMDNTLLSQLPGIVHLTQGVNTLPSLELVPGDLNQDNKLTMEDYSVFVGCYGEKTCNQKTQSDFNDDGQVDGIDYNILLRSFAIRSGD